MAIALPPTFCDLLFYKIFTRLEKILHAGKPSKKTIKLAYLPCISFTSGGQIKLDILFIKMMCPEYPWGRS
jgi:hypothetical protein